MKTNVNFTRFQVLLYYFASFIGLGSFSVENNILRPLGLLRKAYAVILAILSSLYIYFMSEIQTKSAEVTVVNKLFFVLAITFMVVNLWVTLMIFAFKSNKMIDIMNKIIAVKDELRISGTENDFGKNCKNFYVRVIAMNSVVLLMKIMIHFAVRNPKYDPSAAFFAFHWIGRIMINIHMHSAILIFVETMICIRKLFESLNKKLQDTVEASGNFLSLHEQRSSPILRMGRNQCIADQVVPTISIQSSNIRSSVEDVENIGKLHGELCNLVESTTDFYTVLLLFAIVRNFIDIFLGWYSLYVRVFILLDLFETTESILLWVQGVLAQTTIALLELLSIAHAATSVSKVGNATKGILHEVWNKYYPEELRDGLLKFSLQLLHNPVTVSAFGFFDLGYSYIYKIFCTLVAYFIIMIQLDTPNSST